MPGEGAVIKTMSLRKSDTLYSSGLHPWTVTRLNNKASVLCILTSSGLSCLNYKIRMA